MEGNQLVASVLFSFYVGAEIKLTSPGSCDTFFNWLNHLFDPLGSFFKLLLFGIILLRIFFFCPLLVHSRLFYSGIVNGFGFSCCSVTVMAARFCACSMDHRYCV